MHPIPKTIPDDLIGGKGFYANEKALKRHTEVMLPYPSLAKAIENDAHSGANRRLGEEGANGITNANASWAGNLTFKRHMGTTVTSPPPKEAEA